MITAHAGLALLGEFAMGLGLIKAVDRRVPGFGSSAGYLASDHVFPLVLMLNGVGRTLEDSREIRSDTGLREILPLEKIPSTDATGVLPYNIGRLFVLSTLDESWHRHQVQTLRSKLYVTAGKIVFHGRAVYLKVSRDFENLFGQVRLRSWEFGNT